MNTNKIQNVDNLKTIVYPASINLQTLFPTFSHDKLEKVAFIIHQTNYYTLRDGYNTLSSSNYRFLLGLNGTVFTYIIKTLLSNNIIQLVKNHSDNNSKCYAMVNTYDVWAEDTNVKKIYDINDTDTPVFILRWVADGHRIKSALNSKYKPVQNNNTPSIIEENKNLQQQVNDLTARVEQMEKLLSSIINGGKPVEESIHDAEAEFNMNAEHSITPEVSAPVEEIPAAIIKHMQPITQNKIDNNPMKNIKEDLENNKLQFEDKDGKLYIISNYSRFKEDIASAEQSDKNKLVNFLFEAQSGIQSFNIDGKVFEFIKTNSTIVRKYIGLTYKGKREAKAA